ncbi:hypothetical protein FGO68_gene17571 [Halteria grandinella]|uniref:Uncharacterized protein n=1 Tax=Halteria grandinella TaxID=5974 RepID=A0A8J8SZX8_HALGN|nr:hypothetical protein FGO68_gene17571 [Halteria grandinella]
MLLKFSVEVSGYPYLGSESIALMCMLTIIALQHTKKEKTYATQAQEVAKTTNQPCVYGMMLDSERLIHNLEVLKFVAFVPETSYPIISSLWSKLGIVVFYLRHIIPYPCPLISHLVQIILQVYDSFDGIDASLLNLRDPNPLIHNNLNINLPDLQNLKNLWHQPLLNLNFFNFRSPQKSIRVCREPNSYPNKRCSHFRCFQYLVGFIPILLFYRYQGPEEGFPLPITSTSQPPLLSKIIAQRLCKTFSLRFHVLSDAYSLFLIGLLLLIKVSIFNTCQCLTFNQNLF